MHQTFIYQYIFAIDLDLINLIYKSPAKRNKDKYNTKFYEIDGSLEIEEITQNIKQILKHRPKNCWPQTPDSRDI